MKINEGNAYLKPDISISLVSLNQRHDLEKLLPSLLKAANLVEAEILLVDNCSCDGTSDWIQRAYPTVSVLFNPKKSGYGENHNLNLKRSKGEYFVIMNSDMTVVPEIFIELREYMNTHIDVGIVSPKVLNPDGSVQGLNKRYPTLWDLFLRRFLPGRLQRHFRQRSDYYEMRDLGYDNECEVPFLSGAFMFCRSDILKYLGGFDQRYFLYFEDVDLCRRVQQTSCTRYYPAVSVTHYWNRAAHKNWKFSLIFIKSAWRYFNRWGWKIL